MRTVNGAIAVACLGLMSCGGPAPSSGVTYKPGSNYDPDGDGMPNGTYVDTNNDGVSDGIDTDGDKTTAELTLSGKKIVAGSGGGDGDDGPTGGGDGDSTTAGDGDNDGKCEEKVVRNDRLAPDMLIVLDRSGSMKMNSVNRWDPSVMALENVTASLGGGINFGLMSFPAETDQCAAGILNVPIGAGTAPAIKAALMGLQPDGGTPTSITLAAAHKLLGPTNMDPDAIVVPKYVLLVTDGEPNCTNANCPPPSDFLNWLTCIGSGDPQAITDSVNEIAAMAKDGIKTYVVGYDTGSGNLKTTMDMMAAAGGTGAKSHIVVKSGDELTKAIQDIAGKAASCTVTLDEPVEDPTYVLVTIDKDLPTEVKLGLAQADGNGFTLADDLKTVTIQGASCDTLRLGVEHKVNVEVLCDPVIF